jgi:hypothetical protein
MIDQMTGLVRDMVRSARITFFLVAISGIASSGILNAQTFNWGSAVFSELVDSKGNTLDNTYVFELGSFVNGFNPDETNTGDWYANWQVFDAADYNGVEETNPDEVYGYFTSTVQMTSTGTSNSTSLSSGAISFEGLDAYLWVRNSNLAVEGSEWLLSRAADWEFPAPDDDCCGNGPPIEFSTSDLAFADVPKWGSQGGATGGGEITNPGVYTLQTATFVPEPSVMLLSGIAGILLIFRRNRQP